MRLVLDTHTFIWFFTDSSRISVTVNELIEDENNEKLLSTASIWEMAIKHSTSKLSFGQSFKVFIDQQLNLNSIDLLKINLDHIAQVATLPLHHRDPFDRLLIAQTMVEQISILSADLCF